MWGTGQQNKTTVRGSSLSSWPIVHTVVRVFVTTRSMTMQSRSGLARFLIHSHSNALNVARSIIPSPEKATWNRGHGFRGRTPTARRAANAVAVKKWQWQWQPEEQEALSLYPCSLPILCDLGSVTRMQFFFFYLSHLRILKPHDHDETCT